ncbi:MAG: beta-N-acetylhexosaminidase [Candidatus Symbiothrix sp.]|jgi:hexosaminidase|nr:beta-N-acetylhexosaminidase [Candidatus Symbiothrix sp.]
MWKLTSFFIGLGLFSAFYAFAHKGIVPEPVAIKTKPGYFVLNKNRELKDLVERKQLPAYDSVIGEEGYRLIVDQKRISVEANAAAGWFYALQTLNQLTEPTSENIQIPCVEIVDYPRFAWRGSHWDVSRHFFDVEAVKKHLDVMAMYKLNKFHWHLTDDQGWRIEIDRYPKLTEIGAWRVERDVHWNKNTFAPQEGEKATYGGFYTKQQVREIVDYAAQRGIEVIPEIEIPGHCSEILAAYPELACDSFPYFVQPGSYWPPKAILCGGNDQTMIFLKNVIDEVIDLFPSTYIHIGGDEAFKDNWKVCSKCQQRIHDLNLKDEEALQGWMICEMEKHIAQKGKRIIGWDEILDGDVTPAATVMYWRGWLGDSIATEAVNRGHKVIMTPNTYCYLDYYQVENDSNQEAIGGYLPIEKVYSFNPVPASFTPEQAQYILGGQANLWSEFLNTPEQAQYMLLPRLLALSECVWSPSEKKNPSAFIEKLPAQKRRLTSLGYNCH